MLEGAWLSNTVSVTGGLVHAANCSPPQDLSTYQPSVSCPGDLAMVTSSNCLGFSVMRWQVASLSEQWGTHHTMTSVMSGFVFLPKRTFLSTGEELSSK